MWYGVGPVTAMAGLLAGFAPPRIVPLPVAVETAAWAVAGPAELRVLVNRPGTRETLQLRVHEHGAAETLAPLPFVVSGAVGCDDAVVVTGARGDGTPVVAGIDATGGVGWTAVVPGPAPTRWPSPGCAAGPVVAWQTARGRLELASAGPGGLAGRRTVDVGGPPLEIVGGGGSVWAVWSDGAGVRAVEVRGGDARTVALSLRGASQVALSPAADGAVAAWAEGGTIRLATLAPGRDPERLPTLDDPDGDAGAGSLAVLSAPSPFILAQRPSEPDGEPVRWRTTVIAAGRAPVALDVETRAYAVAWWREHLVVVTAGEVRLLRSRER